MMDNEVYDGREIERAQAIVRKFYPEMKPTYVGRRVQIAIEAERESEVQAFAHNRNVGLTWACDRWRSEVHNRPLVNVHRRSLDDAWRQVVRYFGGNDVALLGPCHDELIGYHQMITTASKETNNE
jgi:hypothetical protein